MEQFQEFKKTMEWVKQFPVEAAELIEKQKQEYITLSQSIEEDDAMIQQLQDEIKLLKLHETILLERVKKAESKIRFHKYMEVEQQNLAMAQEIAWYKEMIKGENDERSEAGIELSKM